METYISVPLATLGIGLLLSVLALYLFVKTANKVRASAWWLAFVSVGLNGAGIYCQINPYVFGGSYSYMLGLPALGTLAIVWFIGFFVTIFSIYPLIAPYQVHGLHSQTPPLEMCVALFWPLAALGGYVLYIAYSVYSPKGQEKSAEVAPITWEEARKKAPAGAETVEATKEDKEELPKYLRPFAPPTLTPRRKKKVDEKAEKDDAAPDENDEEEEEKPATPGEYPKKQRKGERW